MHVPPLNDIVLYWYALLGSPLIQNGIVEKETLLLAYLFLFLSFLAKSSISLKMEL